MSAKVSDDWKLKIGDKLRCIESIGSWLTKGRIYEVVKIDSYGYALSYNNDGELWFPELATHHFEVVKEGEEMDTKVSRKWKLKVGDKVLCTESSSFWTEGKLYEVVAVDSEGDAVSIDDGGDSMWPEVAGYYFEPVEDTLEDKELEVSVKVKLDKEFTSYKKASEFLMSLASDLDK